MLRCYLICVITNACFQNLYAFHSNFNDFLKLRVQAVLVRMLSKLLILKINYFLTGRCKSALHKFIENVMEKVSDNVSKTKRKNGITQCPGTMILPHCTWDKFGDILANNGGRLYGLFDELVSFFSTMNMYSSSKSSVQDNREYQDFLKMFTGKAKNRETSKLYLYTDKLYYAATSSLLII